MILDAILNFFYNVCQTIIDILPDENFLAPDPDTNLWQISRAIEYICPGFFFHTLMYLTVTITICGVIFTYKIIKVIRG